MTVTVVIPVGPGHAELAERAIASVHTAWETTRGPFTGYWLAVIGDDAGELGRSRARNLAMREQPADWLFLLDADDTMHPRAFERVVLAEPATFGAIYLDGIPYRGNRYPVTRATLFEHGADGTLSMGCFVRGDLGLEFDEEMDVGEDFDFYARLPGFVKIAEPLADIGYGAPSASGPRSSAGVDWREACAAALARYA